MKIALVYDRVNKWGGAERVLLALHELFPDAPLFTSVYSKSNAKWADVFPEVKTSFLQKIPSFHNNHEKLPLLMPLAFEGLNFKKHDLVISVTSEAGKGIITTPKTRHICYCLTPTRYLWSGYNDYFKTNLKKKISSPLVSYLRNWDKAASARPDIMVAISKTVQSRIKKFYKRESHLIYPPVDIATSYSKTKRGNFFLVVSRLVPYKKVDLVIEVFNQLKWPLIVIGKGSEENKLRALAGKNIKFLSQLTEKELISYYERAKALVFPQEEDFGLVAVEAQSVGTPVIAYKKGGATEIVKDNVTGIFFDKQTAEGLKYALQAFSEKIFDQKKIIESAKRFSKDKFKRKFLKLIENATR